MYKALTNPRSSRNSDLNLIPLINVVLLLLIFFLIVGQIANTQDQDIRLPSSVSDKPIEHQRITLSLDTRNQLSLNGEQVLFETLGAALKDALSDNPQPISLRADRDVTAISLNKLLDALRRQGITTVTLYSVNPETT